MTKYKFSQYVDVDTSQVHEIDLVEVIFGITEVILELSSPDGEVPCWQVYGFKQKQKRIKRNIERYFLQPKISLQLFPFTILN